MRPGGQRAKGKTFERLIATRLREAGLTVRRGRQAEGAVEPDLVIAELPGVWLECGHGAQMRGETKLAQAEGDTVGANRSGSICAAVTRRNGEPIRVTMRVEQAALVLPPRAMVQADIDDLIDGLRRMAQSGRSVA